MCVYIYIYIYTKTPFESSSLPGAGTVPPDRASASRPLGYTCVYIYIYIYMYIHKCIYIYVYVCAIGSPQVDVRDLRAQAGSTNNTDNTNENDNHATPQRPLHPLHAHTPAKEILRTANLRTKILDFRGFDASRILSLRGDMFMSCP